MADWRPAASAPVLQARASLLGFIREFMNRKGVLEVETPLLSRAGNSDPAIEQIATEGPARRWLRTSPEYPMKRLLAAGSGDIYELGRVFRRGEAGRHHNPEFTLLEWYRLGWNHLDLAAETTDLVAACGALFDQAWSREQISYSELFQRHLGIDPHITGREELADVAQARGIRMSNPSELDRDAWLDLLMSHLVQPAMPADTISVVNDYPASQAALARIRPGEPAVAERFEVFLGGVELANGYHELSDAGEQRHRFEQENQRRKTSGGTEVPLDENLLAALSSGLPDCAGVALGVDRLLMACLRTSSISEVLAFPESRA